MEWRHTVWPEAQLIYTSIAKVANTSVKTALLESFAPAARLKNPHAAEHPYLTVPPDRIRKRYSNFLHFAVVRDPYDRLVSFYADKIEGTGGENSWFPKLDQLGFQPRMPFADAVELVCSIPDQRADSHFRSQTWLLLGPKGRLRPDLLLRFEQLKEDWELLSHLVTAKTGARLPPLRLRRASKRRPFAEYYDDRTRALVAERYRKDFELLGYATQPAMTDTRVQQHRPKGSWSAVGARAGSAVLDLAVADPGRAADVRRLSSRYLAPAAHSAAGQLNRIDALKTGRIPVSAFDLLIVDESALAAQAPIPTWLKERFESTGRTVTTVRAAHASSRAARRIERGREKRLAPVSQGRDGSSVARVNGGTRRSLPRYATSTPMESRMTTSDTRRRGEALPDALKPVVDKIKPVAKEVGQFAVSSSQKARHAITKRLGRSPELTAPAAVSAPETLQENGFFVVRGLLPKAECLDLAASLKEELGVTSSKERTSTDAVNRFATARQLLLDDRLLNAVRSALGSGFCFLQVSDLQYNHDHVNWHRDSPYRHEVGGYRRDWDDSAGPYGVAKLIVYLESDNAGMGILPGSHLSRSDIETPRVAALEKDGEYTVIGHRDVPNRPLTEAQRSRPLAWRASAGDALIFDERLYHCGRRVEKHRVIRDREGTKLTLSYVFGLDNAHSARMYSYFRYARTETNYRDLPADLAAELERRGLVLSNGWRNYFETAPEELRGVYLRDPSKMDALIQQFAGKTN